MSTYSIYLIHSGRSRRTYIGITTDVARRLRQHNREIGGGARSTEAGAPEWKLVCSIGLLENKSVAMRWEKIAKLSARGLNARREKLWSIFSGTTHKSRDGKRSYESPKGLQFTMYCNNNVANVLGRGVNVDSQLDKNEEISI